MKPTQYECIEQAIKSSVLCDEYTWLHVTPKSLKNFAITMYRKGQEDMRERAATLIERTDLSNLPTDWQLSTAKILSAYIDSIRALPIGDSND